MKNSISCPRLEKRKDCPETHKNYNFEDLQRPGTYTKSIMVRKKVVKLQKHKMRAASLTHFRRKAKVGLPNHEKT